MKAGKAPGPSGIVVEMIQAAGDEGASIFVLLELCPFWKKNQKYSQQDISESILVRVLKFDVVIGIDV